MPYMGVVYELLTMFKISRGSTTVRLTAGRITTTDPRFHVYGAGVTIERPNDVRGDSVNQLCIGGRLDVLTEALDERRRKSDQAAATEIDNDVRVAQAIHDVPVTGLEDEPVAA